MFGFTVEFLLFIVICAAAIILQRIAKNKERKYFNEGKCFHCGSLLRQFDTDSQGSRGYICDACGYTTWCSYDVDKCYANNN